MTRLLFFLLCFFFLHRLLFGVSFQGGPGFELYACQEYFKRKKNYNIQLELTSMDYERTWGEYARLMGYRFIHYDLKRGNLLSTLGYQPGQLHFVIFSAVMEM